MKWMIMLFLGVMMMGMSSAAICYQESTNVSNLTGIDNCGGLNYTGWSNFTDTYYASHINKSYAWDGNDSTFAMQNNNEIWYESWYSLNGSLTYLNTSVWWVRTDDTVNNHSISFNTSAGQSCLTYAATTGKLGLKVYHTGIATISYYNCMGSAGWLAFASYARGKTGFKLYEERMIWNVTETPAPSNCWTKTGNVLFIPKGCVFTNLKGVSYKI